MRAFLIAEKPDLMRKIEACYKAHRSEIPYEIKFASQRGHLLTLYSPSDLSPKLQRWSWDTLPIFPENYGGWKYHVIEDRPQKGMQSAADRYHFIEEELHSGRYDFVIHAGDPDQEGELLVNMVLSHAGNKLPVKRFWTNDLTDAHILQALKNLKDDEHDPMLTNLLKAAYARQHWDWIFGMNVTRGVALQTNDGSRTACGRVKTVLLSIVVRREKEIADFKPTTVYGVQADYHKGFTGSLFRSQDAVNNEFADEDQKAGIVWFDTKPEAQNFLKSLSNQAVVVSNERKHVKTWAPKLFKLSTAQMVAGKHGYKDNKVLEIIQGLYERSILSYPRTDCEYLSSDEDFAGILHTLYRCDPELQPFIRTITPADIERVRQSKRWINDAALKESGHSALRPTTKDFDMNDLSADEKFIYQMICKRFVAMFLPPMESDIVTVITNDNGNTFRSTGKTTTNIGFGKIFGVEKTDKEIPPVTKGEVLGVDKFEITEKTTKCPQRFTSPDLIGVCENPAKYLNDKSLQALGKRLKIGTPATRSGIIQALYTPQGQKVDGKYGDGYLEVKKEGKRDVLVPTKAGTTLIHNLSGLMITRVDMTGQWEERLDLMRKGKITESALNEEMMSDFKKMMSEIHDRKMEAADPEGQRRGAPKETGVLCPVCGSPMNKYDWGWSCSSYKKDDPESCNFRIGYDAFGGKLKDKDIEDLIVNGKTSRELSLKSRAGKKYRAVLELKDGKLQPVFNNSGTTGLTCPVCGKPMRESEKSWYCSGYRDGCKFSIWKNTAGHNVTKEEAEALIKDGSTGLIRDFHGYDRAKKRFTGPRYSGRLVLGEDGNINIEKE